MKIKNTGNYLAIKELVKYPCIEYISENEVTLFIPPVPFTAEKINSYPFAYCLKSISDIYTIGHQMLSEKLEIINDTIVPDGIKSDGKFKGFGLDEFVIIKFEPRGSYKYITLVDYFQERCRMECIYGKQTETGLEYFERKKEELEKIKPITMDTIWAGLREGHYQFCSEFNPLWMITIVQFLGRHTTIKRVLDMSAGRGARLIAALALNIDYTGVDPCTCVFKKYETMGYFYRDVFKASSSFEFIHSPFETAEITGQYDLMFSSPPYFDLEQFADEETQSIKNFSNITEWLNSFMLISMRKILEHLRTGGIMAINIDNPKNRSMDYVNPMLAFQFPDAHYIGVIQINRGGMSYNTWCWQKKE